MKVKISRASFEEPSVLLWVYLGGLSLTVFFVSLVGESTLIDEILLLAMLPVAAIGLAKSFFKIGLPARLIIIYFIVALLSSVFSLMYRDGIPVAAPLLGLILDLKLFVFLGALLFLARKSRSSSEVMVLRICKAIIFVGFLNSIFFLRDVFSGGTSLSGIRLSLSSIYGYVPIGLFSHKVNAAMLSSLSLISATILYLAKKEYKYLGFGCVFLIVLLLSSSLKELTVLVIVFFIALRSLHGSHVISNSGKKFLLITLLSLPLLGYVFGSAADKMLSNRISVYVYGENARAALHLKSAEIANDYFPLGSGAGTYSSEPSRSMYYSPLYYKYGLHHYYGAGPNNTSFLMDVGWPKFIAEAGWIGGGAYFLAYLLSFLSLTMSFIRKPNVVNIFGVMIGALIFSSSLGSAVFTGDMGLIVCALLFFLKYLEKRPNYKP